MKSKVLFFQDLFEKQDIAPCHTTITTIAMHMGAVAAMGMGIVMEDMATTITMVTLMI